MTGIVTEGGGKCLSSQLRPLFHLPALGVEMILAYCQLCPFWVEISLFHSSGPSWRRIFVSFFHLLSSPSSSSGPVSYLSSSTGHPEIQVDEPPPKVSLVEDENVVG